MPKPSEQLTPHPKEPPQDYIPCEYSFGLSLQNGEKVVIQALHAMNMCYLPGASSVRKESKTDAIKRAALFINSCFDVLGFLHKQFTCPPSKYYVQLEAVIPHIVDLLRPGSKKDHLLLANLLYKIVLLFQNAADRTNYENREEHDSSVAKETLAKADRYSYYKGNEPYESRLANLYTKAASEAKYAFAREPFLECAGRYIEKHSAKQQPCNPIICGIFAKTKRAALYSQAAKTGPGPTLESM
ncbi:MAG: hypothetical protein KAS93_07125 [Gammaproteobacteria bacterium]|nr:hypothetical protein [Gammaproteobacteria bacterium]